LQPLRRTGYHPHMPFAESPSTRLSGSPERRVWLTIPNALTVLRSLAIVPFAWLAMRGRDREALILFIAAGFTDILDGAIARRFGQASRIGRLLDPLADKLFTGVSFVVLSAFRPGFTSIPKWVMFAVLSRDVLILAGSFLVYSMTRNSGFKASVYGKVNTLLELAVVVCFLAAPGIPFVAGILPGLYAVLLVSLLVSAADYLRTGLRMVGQAAEPAGGCQPPSGRTHKSGGAP
jgi:cardiolipin synthase (CMP-forming)